MSEIKLNPKNITIDEVFRFVDTLDLNKSDGVALKTMIWEVSQKPLQEIVERLEEQTRIDVYCINNSFTQKDKDHFWIKKKAHEEAIDIVKGVMNERD